MKKCVVPDRCGQLLSKLRIFKEAAEGGWSIFPEDLARVLGETIIYLEEDERMEDDGK